MTTETNITPPPVPGTQDAVASAPVLPNHPTVDPFASLVLNRPVKTDKVVIARDPNEAEKLAELRLSLMVAKRQASGGDEEALDKLATLQAEHDKMIELLETITFHFQSIGGTRYSELMFDNPATPNDVKNYKQQTGETGPVSLRFSPTKFPPQLVAETCYRVEGSNGQVIDGLTEEQTAVMWDSKTYNDGDLAALLNCAEGVCTSGSAITELGKG